MSHTLPPLSGSMPSFLYLSAPMDYFLSPSPMVPFPVPNVPQVFPPSIPNKTNPKCPFLSPALSSACLLSHTLHPQTRKQASLVFLLQLHSSFYSTLVPLISAFTIINKSLQNVTSDLHTAQMLATLPHSLPFLTQ